MTGKPTDRWTRGVGLLLVAAHTLAISVLPALHLRTAGADAAGVALHAHADGVPDHTEAPEPPRSGHDHNACHLCRQVDHRHAGFGLAGVATPAAHRAAGITSGDDALAAAPHTRLHHSRAPPSA
ncbi:MAG TPA: hypothetical protein VK936_08065 [Longimicrobiales bacterium]|nr:hypothetical protein [Longimicrobiales bacterium]